MKLNKISADMVSRRPDQTAEWLNRLARQVDIVESEALSGSKKPSDLPIATTYSLGVVKIGQNLSITPEGVLSALSPSSYDYNNLFNKPKINSVELTGDKSLSDLGINIPTSYWGQTAVGGVVGGALTLTDGGKTATISTTGHNSSVAGISIGNTSNYVEAGVTTTSVVSNTGNVNIKPKSGSSVDVFNAKIINLANPVNNNDAANKYYVDTGLSSKQDTLIAGSNINIASDGKTISAVVPTVGDATLTIQKNSTDVGTFTANATTNKTINITVPTTAADVNALPDSTKYAANLSLTIDSSTFVVTGQLKDQDGNNIGNSQTIDLPLESVVVNGSYDSATKEVVLTLENGNTIRFSVADLVSGLQSEITSANPLDADLVDDSTSTNKFVTSSDISTWNAKQDALTAGSNIQINGTTISATDTTYSAFTGATSGTAGTSGLVPAPAAGDDTKYLSGDGLWKTVSQYSLPIASSSTLGGIKVGDNLTIDAGTGVLDATDTTYTAGTNIDITSNAISTQTRGIEYIVGTQGSSTNAWTGTSTDKGCSSGTLYTGKTIVYRLPYAGTSSAATLNLTLPDGTTTGAKGVKYNTGSNVGTTYGAGCDIFMVYDGTNWKTSAWYDSNNYDRLRHQNSVKAQTAITTGKICVGSSAGYNAAAANGTFDIAYPILYAGTDVAAGGTNNNFYEAMQQVNLQSTKSGWTGTTYKMVWMVGTLSGTTFTIDSAVFTDTVPSTDDGKVYTPIGVLADTKTIYFFPSETYWAYKNGVFAPFSASTPTKTSELTNDSGFVTSSGTVAQADQLTNARTIAIGTGATGTATAFDGSSNITIPVTSLKEAYLEWGDKNIKGATTPVDAAVDPLVAGNKWAFAKAASFIFEYSTDGGSTWQDYGSSDNDKIALTSTADGTTLVMGKGSTVDYVNNKLRLTFNSNAAGGNVYTSLRKILIYLSTNGATGTTVTMESRTIGNYLDNIDTWANKGTYEVSGWAGWNSIPYNGAFGGSASQTSQIAQIRLTFNQTGGNKNMSVYNVHFIGVTNWSIPSNLGKTGHLYSYNANQTAYFPSHVFPNNDVSYSLGDSSHRWKNLWMSGLIRTGSADLTLPSSSGTLALTSDIPTVNNATLTIQKNSTNVATFTANASSNVTADISVPTKTSELTNDSGFITSTTTQDFAVQEGSTNPVFDGMTPIKTFTWTVTDTTYRPVYQMDNTGWAYDNMDLTVAYRITVTGTGISQVADIIDRWHSPTTWPVTSVMNRTLSTSNATAGFRYLRAVYPTSSGLNNNTYKLGQEISNYNATSRTIQVDVFKTATGITWNETKPAGPIFTSSTYQANSQLGVHTTRGWIFRAPASFNATSADSASRITSYESATTGSSAIKSGASALTSGHLAYQATDGLVYDISNTAKNMVCDENAKIGYISSNVNANTAIDSRYLRPLCNLGSTAVGNISHGTLALGDRVYLRCTMDSSGNIHSDNYLATSMSAGYTWVPFGTATASNTIYMDTRKPTFYTLNSAGDITHVNGKLVSPDISITNTDPGEGVSLDEGHFVAVTGNPDYSDFLDVFYPVGSYYETSDTSFDPNVAWGGTWTEDTAGRVLVAVDSGTFNTVGDTGGSETAAHSHWQSGGSDSDHIYDLSSSGASSEGLSSRVVTKNRVTVSAGSASSSAMRQTSTYEASPSTLQPYVVVKRWHRIS